MSRKVLQEVDLQSGKKYFTEIKEATSSETGLVKPDNSTLIVGEDGTLQVQVGEVGSTTFTGLTDTPSSYSGQGGKNVRVNSGGTALEFASPPTIPYQLSDLSDDATHRTVTDTEKSTWNAKQNALVSGTSIKTINTASLLGSGDISLQTPLIADTDYLTPSTASSTYEPLKGDDDNYVTDAEKVILSNTSGTNTGDQTINVGTTTTLASTENANVTNSGTTTAPVFDFAIPRGLPGAVASDTAPLETNVIWLDTDDDTEAYRRATQTEAETGTDNQSYMTPLRTSQAIAALVGENIPDDLISSTGSQDSVTNVWVGTQAQYDAIGTKSATTLYFIK